MQGVCWSWSSLARWPSTCRTCCWNPMAARSWACQRLGHDAADRDVGRGRVGRFRHWPRSGCARGINPYRMAARGLLLGLAAFCAVIFAAPIGSTVLFFASALRHRFRRRAVCRRHPDRRDDHASRRALPGAVWRLAPGVPHRPPPRACRSSSAAPCATSVIDCRANPARWARRWPAAATGYSVVYHTEIGLLFLTLIALGPLVRVRALSHQIRQAGRPCRFPT